MKKYTPEEKAQALDMMEKLGTKHTSQTLKITDTTLPTICEGYMADTGIWWAGGDFRLPSEIAEWADMPTRN